MQAVYETIFFHSGAYNFLNRQVCREFRYMIEEIHPLVYMDKLLAEGERPVGLYPIQKVADLALSMKLENVFTEVNGYLRYPYMMVRKAVKKGNIDILCWLILEKGRSKKAVCYYAVGYGNLEILKWARVYDCPWNKGIFHEAVCKGNLGIVQWLFANRCPLDRHAPVYAAREGHLHVLKWMKEEGGFYWNEKVFSVAAGFARLEILKWLKENACPWNEDVCNNAAKYGHLEVLKWAHEEGCEWSVNTSFASVKNGHLEVLKWLREQGCPWIKNFCLSEARKRGHKHVCAWIEEN